jgi:hypothetical protein
MYAAGLLKIVLLPVSVQQGSGQQQIQSMPKITPVQLKKEMLEPV